MVVRRGHLDDVDPHDGELISDAAYGVQQLSRRQTTGLGRTRAGCVSRVADVDVDGLSVQSVMRGAIDYASVRELVFLVAERELGLEPGTLSPVVQTRS